MWIDIGRHVTITSAALITYIRLSCSRALLFRVTRKQRTKPAIFLVYSFSLSHTSFLPGSLVLAQRGYGRGCYIHLLAIHARTVQDLGLDLHNVSHKYKLSSSDEHRGIDYSRTPLRHDIRDSQIPFLQSHRTSPNEANFSLSSTGDYNMSNHSNL